MRTTLSINDELLREAKELAARRKSNVSAVVNDALRKTLRDEQAVATKRNYRTPVYSPSEKGTYLSPAEMKEMLAAEEMDPYRKQ